MRIITRKRLQDYWEKHPETEQPLRAWYNRVEQVYWKNSADVKVSFPSVSIISRNRFVFDIKGGNYRLVVVILFQAGKVLVRDVFTHAEYNRIDVTKV